MWLSRTIMKRSLLSFVLTIGLVFSSATDNVYASKESDEIAKTLAKEFVKEQVKQEVKNFLKNSPIILDSIGIRVTDRTMQYIGGAIATYNLLTAKTDKERLFAAAGIGVAFSPEPYSAMALMAIQTIDLIISMQHAHDLMNVYKEIKEIELRTMALYEQMFTEDYKQQRRIVQGISKTYLEILEVYNLIKTDAVVSFVMEETEEYPTAEQVSETYTNINKLHQLLLDYKVQRILFDGFVQTENLKEFKELDDALDEFEKTNKEFIDSVGKLVKTIRLMFASIDTENDKAKIFENVGEYKIEVQKYIFCSDAMNRIFTMEYFGTGLESHDYYQLNSMKDECIQLYDWENI